MADETHAVGRVQRIAALSLVAMIALAVILVVNSYTSAIGLRLAELAGSRERVAALEKRLREQQDETRAQLAVLGAAPRDLAVLRETGAAARIAAACQDLLGADAPALGACSTAETPVTPTLIAHRATLQHSMDPTRLINGLLAIKPSTRVAALKIEAQPQGPPSILLTLEVTSAGTSP